MLQHIHYLISLDKHSGEKGKIILLQQKDTFETHWNVHFDGHEETEIVYSGPDLEQAWQTIEGVRLAKVKEGYTAHDPLAAIALSAIPLTYLFVRQLECFSLKHMDQALFQDLKQWRKVTAAAANIPPYFIGTDKLLQIISTFIPHTLEELMQIPGIGQNKLDMYGEAIIDISKAYTRPFTFPLDWVKNEVSAMELADWLLAEKVQKEEKKALRLQQEKEEKMRLLECIRDQLSIEEASKRLSISVAHLLKRIQEIAKEGYDVIPYLHSEVEPIKEKDMIRDLVGTIGDVRLKPIFEKMYGSGEGLPSKEKGEKYNRIRLVCTYIRLQEAS